MYIPALTELLSNPLDPLDGYPPRHTKVIRDWTRCILWFVRERRELHIQAGTWWRTGQRPRCICASGWASCVWQVQAPLGKIYTHLLRACDPAWQSGLAARGLWFEDLWGPPSRLPQLDENTKFTFFLRAMYAMERCLDAELVHRDAESHNIVYNLVTLHVRIIDIEMPEYERYKLRDVWISMHASLSKFVNYRIKTSGFPWGYSP